MQQDYVVAPFDQIVVKNNRPGFAGVRMQDALAASRPASLKLRKHERLALQIGDFNGSERGLSGQLEADANNGLDVFWRQSQIAPGLLQLLPQPLNLFVNL